MKEQVVVALAGVVLLTAGCNKVETKASEVEQLTVQDVSEKNVQGRWQGKSVPTLYRGGFFARVDALYWRADEEGLQYGYKIRTDASVPKISGDVLFPKVRWDAGFRVGLGYTFEMQDYWDIRALWTHFQTDSQAAVKSFANEEKITPAWGATILGSLSNTASMDWKMTYNTYDVDLGRDYFVAKTVSVHPFIGLRGATIHQSYHAKYVALEINPIVQEIPTAFKNQSHFWGVGAHMGTGLQWYCMPNFSLMGNVGGSLLYADYKVHNKYDTILSVNQIPVTRATPAALHDHFTRGAVNLEAMVGIEWEQFFYQNKYRLSITAGYEWSVWFSQNQMIKADVVENPNQDVGANIFAHTDGDLTLQGVNLQIRWDF